MRTLLALGLVLGLTSAEAAKTTRATAKRAKATKSIAKKSKAAALPAKEEARVEKKIDEIDAAMAAAPAAPATTVVAPAPVAAAPAKKSVVKLSFYTENAANLDMVNDATLGDKGKTIGAYEFGRVDYKASDKVKLSLLQEYERTYGIGDNEASDLTFADTQLRISHGDLGTLPGDIKVSGQTRLYLPTSLASYNAGQIAQVRTLVTLAKSIDKLTLSYNLFPRYYFQQFRTKDKVDGDKVIQTGNSYFRIFQFIGAEYQVSDAVSVTSTYGVYQGWWHNDPSVGVKNVKRIDGLMAELYTDIQATKWLGLSLGVQSVDPMGGEGATMNGTGVATSAFDARALEYKFAATFAVDL